jgi:hypothetical protein
MRAVLWHGEKRRRMGIVVVEDGGRRAAVHEGRHSAGSAKEEGRKGNGGMQPSGLAQPAGPDRSARPDGHWAGGEKKENRNLF